MYHSAKVKMSNDKQILEGIYRNPSISRTEIADLTGITPATVTHIISDMLKRQMVKEIGGKPEESGQTGRRRISLDICADYAYVLGLEFTISSLSVCAADLKGNRIWQKSIPCTDTLKAHINQTVISAIQEALDSCGIPNDRFLGIGIAVPGHITPNGHFVINSNDSWMTFDAFAVRNAFSLPVVFENNVRCMALGHYLFQPERVPENFAFFHVGMGIYCANVLEGRLYLGHTYICGEIGHTIVSPNGLRCECGKQGCLQTVASEAWLLKNARQLYQLDTSGLLKSLAPSPEAVTIDTLAAAYSLGDESIQILVGNALKYLGISISNIAILMNPEKIFLHGRLFSHPSIQAELLSLIGQQLKFVENNYVENFELSPYHPMDGAEGAAALAVSAFFLNIKEEILP